MRPARSVGLFPKSHRDTECEKEEIAISDQVERYSENACSRSETEH